MLVRLPHGSTRATARAPPQEHAEREHPQTPGGAAGTTAAFELAVASGVGFVSERRRAYSARASRESTRGGAGAAEHANGTARGRSPVAAGRGGAAASVGR